MTYKQKCEKCGHLGSSTISSGTPEIGSTLTTYFTCIKCRNNQNVQIKGS